MLKLNVYCSLIPSSSQVKLGSSYGSLILQYHRSLKPCQGISVKALKDETGGERSGFPSRNWDPGSEIEVPFEQRPVCLHCKTTYLLPGKKEYMPVIVSGFLNGPCMLQTKSPNGEAYIISF